MINEQQYSVPEHLHFIRLYLSKNMSQYERMKKKKKEEKKKKKKTTTTTRDSKSQKRLISVLQKYKLTTGTE